MPTKIVTVASGMHYWTGSLVATLMPIAKERNSYEACCPTLKDCCHRKPNILYFSRPHKFVPTGCRFDPKYEILFALAEKKGASQVTILLFTV